MRFRRPPDEREAGQPAEPVRADEGAAKPGDRPELLPEGYKPPGERTPEEAKEQLDQILDNYAERWGEKKDEKDRPQEHWHKGIERNVEKSREKRAEFADYVAQGLLIKEACEKVGVVRKTYEYWRRTDPGFRRLVDDIRMGQREREDPWEGDFTSFRKKYFGWDTYWHQREIVRAIETAKPSEIVMVLVPPEHGKTTVLEDYICYKLAVDPNQRITYVHESQNFGRRVLRRITQRMTDTSQFPDYIGRFGPFYEDGQERKGKPWSADEFTVAQAKHDERDYSLQVRGWRTAVQGTRTDLLLIDDTQSAKSLNQTDNIITSLRQDFFTRPGKDGRIIIVGTRVGPGDIYEKMLNDASLRDLINLVQLPAVNQDGEPLCPEMWTKEALQMKRKLVGEEAWWRNYQQAPRRNETQTFTEDMVDVAKTDLIQACETPEGGLPVVLGLDPAIAGQNALIAAAYDSSRFIVIDVAVDEGLARTEGIIQRVAEFAARYKPLDVVIETQSLQSALLEDDRMRAAASQYGFRTRPHRTSGRKLDPVLGVGAMAGSFLRGEMKIPYGDQLARSRMDPLIAELLAWRPDVPTRLLKQDTVMALWFAWLFWMNKRQTTDYDNSAWNFSGLKVTA